MTLKVIPKIENVCKMSNGGSMMNHMFVWIYLEKSDFLLMLDNEFYFIDEIYSIIILISLLDCTYNLELLQK